MAVVQNTTMRIMLTCSHCKVTHYLYACDNDRFECPKCKLIYLASEVETVKMIDSSGLKGDELCK